MNLNSRNSLDPRWTAHHVPVVVGFMLAEIVVVRKNPGTVISYDFDNGTYSAGVNGTGQVTDQIWTGMARIQPFGIIGDMVVGQDTTSRRLMRVQIDDLASGINVDDMIYVVSSDDAPELMTFVLEVRGTISSSNPWVTDLVCEADTKHGE